RRPPERTCWDKHAVLLQTVRSRPLEHVVPYPRAGNAWPGGVEGRSTDGASGAGLAAHPRAASCQFRLSESVPRTALGHFPVLTDELAVGAEQIEHRAVEFPPDALFALEDHFGAFALDLPRQHRNGLCHPDTHLRVACGRTRRIFGPRVAVDPV